MILIRIIAPDTVTEVHRLSALWANEAAPAGEIPDRTRWEPLSLVRKARQKKQFVSPTTNRRNQGFPVVVLNDKRKPDGLGRYFKGSTSVLCESKGL